jgi:hypothetical protein
MRMYRRSRGAYVTRSFVHIKQIYKLLRTYTVDHVILLAWIQILNIIQYIIRVFCNLKETFIL